MRNPHKIVLLSKSWTSPSFNRPLIFLQENPLWECIWPLTNTLHYRFPTSTFLLLRDYDEKVAKDSQWKIGIEKWEPQDFLNYVLGSRIGCFGEKSIGARKGWASLHCTLATYNCLDLFYWLPRFLLNLETACYFWVEHSSFKSMLTKSVSSSFTLMGFWLAHSD